MKASIRQRARELGFDHCGFTTAAAPASAGHLRDWLAAGRHGSMAYLERNAAKRVDPQQVLPGANSIICLAASYWQPDRAGSAADADHPHGVVARYARYADYHDILGRALAELTGWVSVQTGHATRSLWYVDTGPVLERDFAQRAGLGFVGKHTNVISPKLGNWILLGEILTTAALEPDEPQVNHCGRCVRCLVACPTQAITAPFQLDARRCISYLTIEHRGPIPLELRRSIGNRVFGCDDCLAVCPWNRFARAGQLLRTTVRPDLAELDLIALLALSESEFQNRFRGTPLWRTKRRGLLRNACVALGNVGSRAALPALVRIQADGDALVAEHADWAIREIQGRNDASLG